MTRFAVLGAGRIGQVHARAIAQVEGAALVAIADPIAAPLTVWPRNMAAISAP